MFKNSKMLKGMVLALALVLVLGAGVLLNFKANAETNTVVYYVSDSGNNTTGKDAATAFRTFEAVTEAANKLNLAPGTELKILVVDQVFIKTRELDKNTVRDSAGNKVHITITSASEEKATILHYAYSSSGSTSYEKIFIDNDITFRNIIISGQVQSYYESNAPVTAEKIDYGKFYRTRNLHIGSNTVEFDNCEFTSTYPSQSAARTWVLFCDDYAKSEVEGGSHLRLLNGDYSNCTVYVQDQITPLWDLSIYVENASTSTVYALADTDTTKTANAKSVTCTFKDATVASYNPQGRGNVGVTEGVTAVFEGDTVIKNWVACMSSSSSTGTYHGDLRYYFRDNCSISVTSTDSNDKKIIYLAPVVMYGDLYVTVEGGTFNQMFCTGTDANKSATSVASVLNGSVYNEFKGGTFKGGITCGMGEAGDTLTGTITNNFYDGFNLSSGTSYLSSRGGKCGTTTNNIYGGTFGKIETYFGGGNNLANTDKNVIEGDLINNIYGGTWASTAWVGPHSQTITGGLYNNFMGGTFSGTFVAGGVGIVVDEIHNNFKNGPDGTYATLKGTTCLGSRGKNSYGPNVQNINRIYNTFEGDVTVTGALYCAGGSQSGGKQISELVVNDFRGGTFSGNVYCGTRYAKDDLSTCDIINNYHGGTFSATLYGGGLEGTIRSVTNNYYDTITFAKEVYAGGSGGSIGAITNNYRGATFKNFGVYGGGTGATSHCGAITNNYYDGTYGLRVHGGGFRGSADSITNNFYEGCTFNSYVFGASEKARGSKKNDAFDVIGDVTNNFYGGTFNSQLIGGGFIGTVDQDTGDVTSVREDGMIYNNWYGGYYKYFVYGGGNGSNYNNKDVVNTVYGGEFNAWLCGGHANSRSIKITNNIYGGLFTGAHKEALHSEAGRSCFYGGDWSNASSGTGQKVELISNNIYGGTFEARVYLGGRISTAAKVESMIAGGIFNGDRLQPGMFQHSAANNATITLDIKPDESDELLLLGCHYTAYGVDGEKVYYSCGLECLNSRKSDTVTLYAAEKPIYIAGNSFLNFDKVLGEVTFIQTENWQNGNVYVSVPDSENLDMIKFVNVDASLTGSAVIETTMVNVEDLGTKMSRVALVGDDTAVAPEAITLPELKAFRFVLDNNLQVDFYADKTAVEDYVAKAGAFTAKITLDGDALMTLTISSMDDAEIVGSYVKISTGFTIPAFDYGKTIGIDFAGNYAGYTVYELLKLGVTNSADNAKLVDLLKAIYNYGYEADLLRDGSAAVSDPYDGITYTGTYNGKASATSANTAYKFVGTGLSLGKEVSLNFYMKAETLEGLSFTAASESGELNVSRILVTPFAGNTQYNVVISLTLDVASMNETFTLSVKNSSGAELATCTNSVANGCASYVAADGEYAPVSEALLAYVEKALAYKNA